MRDLPKTGDVFYQITINKGVVTKSNPMVVKDNKYRFSLRSYEFTNGANRFDVNNLYPCDYIRGGPVNAPLGLGYKAFIYALEKDVEEATNFLKENYAADCIISSHEAEEILNNLRKFATIATGKTP